MIQSRVPFPALQASLKGTGAGPVDTTLKEHSVVVVKKEFQLRKVFTFFKNAYLIKH